MSVLAQGPDNQDVIFVKGAPEAVLDKCSHVSMLSSNVTAAKTVLCVSDNAFISCSPVSQNVTS